MLFEDNEGLLYAVRKDGYTAEQAAELAREGLETDRVHLTNEYTHMYYGFGASDGEVENNWWLVDSAARNGTAVYVFRKSE